MSESHNINGGKSVNKLNLKSVVTLKERKDEFKIIRDTRSIGAMKSRVHIMEENPVSEVEINLTKSSSMMRSLHSVKSGNGKFVPEYSAMTLPESTKPKMASSVINVASTTNSQLYDTSRHLMDHPSMFFQTHSSSTNMSEGWLKLSRGSVAKKKKQSVAKRSVPDYRATVRAAKLSENYRDSMDFSAASFEIMSEFHITERKRQQLLGFMQKNVIDLKNKEFKRKVEAEYPRIVKKNTTHQDMFTFADQLPTVGIDKYVVRDIVKRTGMKKQREAYKDTFNGVIREFSAEFVDVTHKCGVSFRVRALDGSEGHPELPAYKYYGKTPQYKLYLKRRRWLQRHLFIQYPLMRKILYLCDDLPQLLADFSKYRRVEMEIPEIKKQFDEELCKGINLLKKYHFTVSKLMRSHVGEIPSSPEAAAQFLRTGTGMLASIISRLLRNTILHIVEVTGDDNRIPFLKLNLTYDRRLHLTPSEDETVRLYVDLVEFIAGVGKELLSLECIIYENTEESFVPIYMENEFLKAAKVRIKENIRLKYQPVNAYVDMLDSNFASLYPARNETGDDADKDGENKDITFEEGMAQIDFYLNLIQQMEEIVTNEYYAIGAVEQEECKANLKASIRNLIDDIAGKLVLQHEWENEDICETFEKLAAEAVTIPKSSEELMAQGVYMTWANTVLLTGLRERIQRMLVIICRLMDITTITWTHMNLNARTCAWLWKIKPILEQNSSIYETYKFEFEERLVNAVAKLNEDIEDINPQLVILDNMTDSDRAREYINQMSNILVRIRNCEQQKIWINNEEKTFKYPISPFKELEEVKSWVYIFYHLVKLCMNWNRLFFAWMDGPFEFLDPASAEETVEGFYKELMKIQKMYRTKLRQMAAEQNPRRFQGSADDPDPTNQPAPLQLCRKTMQAIKDFRPALSLMLIMCNSALLQRHWDEMSEIAGFDMTPNAGTSLRKITLMDLGPSIDEYEIISSGAIKELQLITNLKKMIAEWDDVNFKTTTYKDTGMHILSQLDDIQVILDDHIMKTLTMRGSIFVKPYETQVKAWYEKITRMNATIEEWGKVQSQWLYLLPIFSSKDIVNQMPSEGILFKEVDQTYKRYMSAVSKDPKVISTAGTAGLLEAMQGCTAMLEKINEGVTAYLEKKRLYFPRFFFLSNDEMLEILSETKDPLRVQPHLRKCFEAINKLEFDEQLQIHAMMSEEGEKVKFLRTIKPSEAGGSVEKWLIQVEEQMLASMLDQIYQAWLDFPTKQRTQWMQIWPGQIVLCVSQIFWSANVHLALQPENSPFSLKQFSTILTDELQDTVALVRDPNLTNLAKITIKALIVIDVHAKDVVANLVEQNVDSDTEFKWLCQLRYYWENDVCNVKILNASVKYACEYLGNSDRLVITPLTDRCYRTLISAYHLHLNGAPEGPAGTGKTETTKDLAKAIAVQCVVFNCSDGLDYKAMGKFFKGLASAGAWACFDEFNRIEIEVLSVVAQQILCIIMAVRGKVKKFMFEGTELILNPAVYVCITMNPGYAGRSELPDNLKVLFRTVAMMVPDYAMIGEISLYSYGFVNARVLSVKIVTVYRLCSEQLSSQNHYDYGMRAVKSVLSAAGNNKRAYPNENEDILLLRSIIDINLAKFLNHDIPLFEGIISDLFPGVRLPKVDYDKFVFHFVESCRKRNLQPRASFELKVIQTYEMMIVRHGFMIVGEPFAGKTSTLKVLADTLTRMNEAGLKQLKVQYQYMNPKSITMGQLYGQSDPVSNEWTDGVVATCFRNFVTDPAPDRKWVIFDGPVDAVWIENMNTVLDDNKKLCLMSGEVMVMTSSMSMIFEVMDLAQASPATVSRCGMIYMEPATLGWRPFYESWLVNQTQEWNSTENTPLIKDLFDWLIDPCLYFIRKNCKQLCTGGEINAVKNVYQIVEMVLDDACTESTKKEEDFKYMPSWIQATFIYAGVWGLAGTLDSDSREKFDEFFKNLWRGENPELPYPKNMEKLEVQIPQEGLLCDYAYVYRLKGSWKYWLEIVRNQRVEDAKNIQQALVPTVDTAKYMTMVDLHIKHNLPVLLVGPTGTGKSYYMQDHLMNKLDQEVFEPSFITFTVKITANQTQEMFISKLHKFRRGIYGAPKGKTSIIFVDDMNMPVKETYGAQPPIELLRQYFDHKNWYDLKDTSVIQIKNMLILAAMGLVGGSRQDVYQRFLRHFSIFGINDFSEESMSKIFQNILLLGWKKNGFPSDVINTVNWLVAGTLDVYLAAIEHLRPTPAKSHYIFNLRDFSRVIFGCALLRKESAEDKKIFSKLWVHEVMRVFYDRMTDKEDKNWLFEKLRTCVRDHFREFFDSVFDDFDKSDDGRVLESSMSGLMFGTYLDADATEDEVKYEPVQTFQAIYDLAQSSLEEYNTTHKTKMDIVLFRYAIEHLSRICRVLSIPGGSALLVGVSGSGRQSLTKLATAIAGFSFFQPEIGKNYGMNEWREDIKRVLKESGGRGKSTTFLFSEGQIKEEGFLEDIDSLLNSGEVPNIFPIDEKQEILEMVRLAAQGGNRNLDVSALFVYSYFIKRCKERLHMMLCFSPIGSSFRSRLRMFPSLVNCCTIDWFEDWPEDALEMVAHNWIGDIHLPDGVKDSAVVACKEFHVVARKVSALFYLETSRKTYVTSASYLELIKSFTSLTNAKQKEIMTNKNRYLIGLEKLQSAADAVGMMQHDLAEIQPQLLEMTNKAIEMTKQIERETAEVEKASNLVRADEKVANLQAASSQALKRECEADLADAIPILEDAIQALNTLKPSDITLVKSMKNPPEAVKLVMAAVCVMRDIKPDRLNDATTGGKILDYWGPSKKLLGDMNFLQILKDFDKDHIKPEIMAKIRKEYLPNKLFKPQIVLKASSAAEGLCKWIIAMDLYDAVAKEVAPKKEKLEQAEREYQATMDILLEKKAQLALLEEKLANLNKQLEEANAKQQELQDNVNLCANKLRRAEKLLGGLGGEKTRWIQAADNLQLLYDSLAGDILICCGVIAYLSPFTMHHRYTSVTSWHKYVKTLKIPCSDTFDFTQILGSDIKLQNWCIHGLPRDSFSMENSIIQDSSRRWSLLIDPQNQANLWIKKLEKKNELEITKFSDANYMKLLEKCIQAGKPVLIESIEEELEAPLDPLLYKMTFMQAGTEVISLGDNVIPYHKNFKLYLTSNLRNPHYLPEVFNKVTIINFSLTVEGLEDQLLGIVVAKERPDLQRQREELIVQSAENKASLAKVEENILKTLSESKGDILEDESAIEILDFSKILSQDIQAKQKSSKETEKKIEGFRMDYKPIAEHSAGLYYCVSDLPNVDPMYQYSLAWFIHLYMSSIESANKSRDLTKRLKFLEDTFTYNLYTNVCRSLFEKDKLMFSFLLCTMIMSAQKKLTQKEIKFILTGGVNVENPAKNPQSNWLNDKSWNEICRVNEIPAFQEFREHFELNPLSWKQLYDVDNPQDQQFPQPWERTLTPFHKLIVIRLFRPDKLYASISKFVSNEMGVKFIQPPPFDIAKSFEESTCVCPLIFILSPGNDPMAALVKFAEFKGMNEMFNSISLGQGQGPIAQELIETAQQEGGWVCLQNCHLAVSWMSTLEKLWEGMELANTNEHFRLWLTSYPSDKFPISILQYGVKMTNEPPSGLQQNLLRSYTNEPIKDPDFYNGCPGRESQFARLLYGIAFFHAVVQERRTFGPLGWNISYGFNESDLDISVQQLQMFINEFGDNSYEAITYLTGECNYGGRVTDDWDRRLIVTILDDFANTVVVDNLDYQFVPLGDTYALPRRSTYDDYFEHISNLPQIHPPEVFGLHKNAGITRDLKTSQGLLDSMILVQGEGTAGGTHSETGHLLMIITVDILGKIPPNFDIEQTKLKYPVSYKESMNTVLGQEMERFNKLLSKIRTNLKDVQKAIKGLVIMTPELETLANSLILGRIPAVWEKVSYPSLKSLPNYIADFVERLRFLQTWYERGKPPTFWISGFFFTQAFLTGAKQNYARKFTIPIDQLTFDFDVLKIPNANKAPTDGIYVYGLFTDGARWDLEAGVLKELKPKILNDTMPLIWIKPVLVKNYVEVGRYRCPLYKTSERKGILSTTGHSTNYVLPFLLKTFEKPSHWVKRSVALLCQLD